MESSTTTQKAVLEFLQSPSQLTAVIATVDKNSEPQAATVYYYANQELHFYFLTATGTHKYENLIENPSTAIVIGTGPEKTTIQGNGQSVLLEKGSDEEAMAMIKIKKRLNEQDGTWPIFQMEEFDDEAIAVFKFTPTSLQLLNLESDNNLPITTQDIETII